MHTTHSFASNNRTQLLRIFPVTGGSLEDVLASIREHDADVLKEAGDKRPSIEVINSHIIGAIENYREQHNGIPHTDDEIVYIGQGYINVVVYIPPLKQLLRISKFVDAKKIERRIEAYNAMKRFPDNGFLVPNSFNYASSVEQVDGKEVRKEYMYWEINRLEPIVHPDESAYKDCIRRALTFLQNPEINFGYIDFKYLNFMQRSSHAGSMNADGMRRSNLYYIADFDIHSRWNIGGEYPTLTVDDLKRKYSNRVITRKEYFGEFVFDGIVGLYRDKGWDQGMMLTAIYARLFLLKLRYDLTEGILKNRSFTENGATDDDCEVYANDWMIEQACSMRSCSPDDVVDIDDEPAVSISGGSLDKVYPGKFSDVRSYDDSPYTVVFTHGHNPHGNLYCAKLFEPLRKLCDAKHISNVIYYRSYTYSDNSFMPVDDSMSETIEGIKCYKDETRDFESDYNQLKLLLADNNIDKQKLILVGHSWGGFFVGYLSKQFGVDKCIKSISLDGWNFYQVIPYFMEHNGGISNVDTSQIVYEPTRVLYKGSPVDLPSCKIYQKQYEFGYKMKDEYRPDDHILVEYTSSDQGSPASDAANKDHPDTVDVQPVSEPPYKHVYNFAYGDKYSHSLHALEPCAKVIFDRFIL